MKKKANNTIKTLFSPANPEKWSDESKRSLSYVLFAPEGYADRNYRCYRCGKSAVFSAADQKYTYEVKKAYIHQRRKLCPDCWKPYQVIKHDIKVCEEQWVASKESLKNNADFLAHWLNLLLKYDAYEPYKKNLSTQNMLKKLVGQ